MEGEVWREGVWRGSVERKCGGGGVEGGECGEGGHRLNEGRSWGIT